METTAIPSAPDSNRERLRLAIRLLRQVLETWDEDDVVEYGSDLSFDELIAELASIEPGL